MNNLNIKQLNNLQTGQSLAVEIQSSTDDLRAFIVIGAYRNDGTRASKFINTKHSEDNLYWFRKYEVKKEDIENDLYLNENDLINSVFINGIKNIYNIEIELRKYLSDFSSLDVEWKCDNPV